MNRISVGSVYVATWAYSGQNNRGPYEMLKVTNEKGKEPITIFVNNVPTGIAKGERFVINKVTDVICKWRKGMVWNSHTKQKEEGWEMEYDINADVTRVSSAFDGVSTDVLANELDGFDVGVAPWDELSVDEQLPM